MRRTGIAFAVVSAILSGACGSGTGGGQVIPQIDSKLPPEADSGCAACHDALVDATQDVDGAGGTVCLGVGGATGGCFQGSSSGGGDSGPDAPSAADASTDADAESGAIPCIPMTCADYPAGTCAQQSDGCGNLTANCGSCTAPEFCGGGGPGLCGGGGPAMCSQSLCVPLTCAAFDCGAAGDGCGGLLECGSCPRSEEVCATNQCVWPADAGPCVPATCQGLGYDCGVLSDGCGGHIQCGTCPVSQFCGGGGAHRCGGTCSMPEGGDPCQVTCSSNDGGSCIGQSCEASGIACGEAPNGCGGLIECGPCGGDAGAADSPAAD